MEGRLQQVVTAIEEMSSRGEFSKLLTHLQAQEEVLIQAMPQLDDLLPVLNPASHTLGMVYILHCKAAAVPLSNLQAVNTFLSQCRTVLLGGDPEQIRIIPKEFVAARRAPPWREHARPASLQRAWRPARPAAVAPTASPPPRALLLSPLLHCACILTGRQQILGGGDRDQVAARRRAPAAGCRCRAAAGPHALHAAPR